MERIFSEPIGLTIVKSDNLGVLRFKTRDDGILKMLPARLVQFISDSPVSLSVARADDPDASLCAVNERFSILTGYRSDEVVGRNCRFLQGDLDNEKVRAKIRAFLADDTIADGRFELANERKDGSPFRNLIYMTRLQHQSGSSFILASQFDLNRYKSLGQYTKSLNSEISILRDTHSEFELVAMGTLDSLAMSTKTIARALVENDVAKVQ